jgi:dolichol kinase
MEPVSVKRSLRRASVHFAVGAVILACWYILTEPVFFILLVAGTAGVLTLDLVRLRLPALSERLYAFFEPVLRGGEARRVTGATYFLIGCLVCLFLFPGDIAVLAVLFLSLGDPAAAVFGAWKGRTRCWGKSLEGDAACLVICLVVAVVASRYLSGPELPEALVGAFVAALFQALPSFVNDNLTIPIGSGLVMFIISRFIG